MQSYCGKEIEIIFFLLLFMKKMYIIFNMAMHKYMNKICKCKVKSMKKRNSQNSYVY